VLKKSILVLFSVILLLLLSACGMKQKAPVFKGVETVKIIKLTPDNLDLLLYVRLENLNHKDLKVHNFDLKILDGQESPIGKIDVKPWIQLPANRITTVEIPVQLRTRDCVRLINSSFPKVTVYLQGSCQVVVWGISKRIDFHSQYTTSIMPFVQDFAKGITDAGELIKFTKTSLPTLSFQETTVKMHFLLMNPYGLAMTIEDFPCSLTLNSKEIGKGQLEKPIQLKAEEIYSEGDLVLHFNNLQSILQGTKSLFQGEKRYQAKGVIKLNIANVRIEKPYEFNGELEFQMPDITTPLRLLKKD